MRLIYSDAHRIDGSALEPCDHALVQRVVADAISLGAEEVIENGDGDDVTRGGEDLIPRMAQAAVADLRPLFDRGIRFTKVLGNHEGSTPPAVFARALVAAGADPALVLVAGGSISRGVWQIEHGHRFDPSCAGGPLTEVGEGFTRLDWWGEHIGIDLDDLNPMDWHGWSVIDDIPMHRRANRQAELTGSHLVLGHSHIAYARRGHWHGRRFAVLNDGGCVRGCPYSYAWIEDAGAGEVFIETVGN